MHHVKIPEDTMFVAKAVYPVIDKVVGQKKQDPTPPNIRRHLERREFVQPKEKRYRKETESDADTRADHPDQQIDTRIFKLIFTRSGITVVEKLQAQKKREG
jgi:hypothetical protein